MSLTFDPKGHVGHFYAVKQHCRRAKYLECTLVEKSNMLPSFKFRLDCSDDGACCHRHYATEGRYIISMLPSTPKLMDACNVQVPALSNMKKLVDPTSNEIVIFLWHLFLLPSYPKNPCPDKKKKGSW